MPVCGTVECDLQHFFRFFKRVCHILLCQSPPSRALLRGAQDRGRAPHLVRWPCAVLGLWQRFVHPVLAVQRFVSQCSCSLAEVASRWRSSRKSGACDVPSVSRGRVQSGAARPYFEEKGRHWRCKIDINQEKYKLHTFFLCKVLREREYRRTFAAQEKKKRSV